MRATISSALLALLGFLGAGAAAEAGEVEVREVRAVRAAAGGWIFHVTLAHADTGWEHYADAWRVVAEDGRELARRALHHPHVDEQPFTRSLSGVELPPGTHRLYVQARDTVHGWSADRVEVRLDRAEGPRYRVER